MCVSVTERETVQFEVGCGTSAIPVQPHKPYESCDCFSSCLMIPTEAVILQQLVSCSPATQYNAVGSMTSGCNCDRCSRQTDAPTSHRSGGVGSESQISNRRPSALLCSTFRPMLFDEEWWICRDCILRPECCSSFSKDAKAPIRYQY